MNSVRDLPSQRPTVPHLVRLILYDPFHYVDYNKNKCLNVHLNRLPLSIIPLPAVNICSLIEPPIPMCFFVNIALNKNLFNGKKM